MTPRCARDDAEMRRGHTEPRPCDHVATALHRRSQVMVGFGRTGKFWGFQHYDGLLPDIVTSAKGLSAAYLPLSMVAMLSYLQAGITSRRDLGAISAQPRRNLGAISARSRRDLDTISARSRRSLRSTSARTRSAGARRSTRTRSPCRARTSASSTWSRKTSSATSSRSSPRWSSARRR